MTSDNPAVAGRFVEESFSAKRHDATTIKNNTDDLSKPKVKIDELNAKVTEDGTCAVRFKRMAYLIWPQIYS